MKKSLLIIAGYALFSAAAVAMDFYVEDNTLVPIPSDAEAKIRQTESNFKEAQKCKFAGKPVDLDGDGRAEDFIVTTRGTCLWAAAAGPIWVLKKTGTSYSLVLAFTSSSLELSKRATNGLRDITISRGSAGYAEVVVWSYDGKQYQKTASHFFDATNPDACKANPDICPFAVD